MLLWQNVGSVQLHMIQQSTILNIVLPHLPNLNSRLMHAIYIYISIVYPISYNANVIFEHFSHRF